MVFQRANISSINHLKYLVKCISLLAYQQRKKSLHLAWSKSATYYILYIQLKFTGVVFLHLV